MRQKSEYRKSYRPSKEVANLYSERLRYRQVRRSMECSHHPWAWSGVGLEDREATESVSSDSYGPEDQAHHLPTPDTPPVAPRNAEKYYDTDPETDEGEYENYSDDEVERLKRRAVAKAMQSTDNFTDEEDDDDRQYQSRPLHPKFRSAPPPRRPKTSHSPRIRSASKSRRPQTSLSKSRDSGIESGNLNGGEYEAPKRFLSYGYGSGDGRKTFNVTSDIDVYPSALRAAKRRELEMIHRQKKAELASLKARRIAALFNSGEGTSGTLGPQTVSNLPLGAHGRSFDDARMNRVTKNEWISEYQRQFPGYADLCYKMNRAKIATRGVKGEGGDMGGFLSGVISRVQTPAY